MVTQNNEERRDDDPKAFSFSIKDLLVFGTVLVSVVSAWGMINTRLSLLENSLTIQKELLRKFMDEKDTEIGKIDDSIDNIVEQLRLVKEQSRDTDAALRRYAYMLRRLQPGDQPNAHLNTP